MISRRVFLKNGSLALVSLGFAPSFVARAAEAAGGAAGRGRRKVLITVFQRGAVDGLNMVVPFGERAYYSARPSIAIAQPGRGSGGRGADSAIDLDGFFGLHPRMASLQPLWASRQMAIVHACGSPDTTRSHFDAQDYMESGTPGVKSTEDGWLNRYLNVRQKEARQREEAATKDTPFRAVALTSQLPRTLQGTAPALAMQRIEQFGLRGAGGGTAAAAMTGASFEEQYAAAADRALNRTGKDAFDAMRMLKSADPAKYQPENGAVYPRSAYGEALRQIAQLVKADVGLEVAFAESGQWDHHVNEGGAIGQIANRLDDFASGLAALAIDLGARMEDVIVLTMSEFGRAVAENGNRGTDHGHGNAMFAIGGAVRGGKVYGKWPGLAPEQRFEGRDLAVTTDFRDVFGEIVVHHLGVKDASTIFPGYAIKPGNFPGFLA
jgi:uncharacterized protein (DUF1501 family)